MASENNAETITDRKYGSLAVASLNSTFSQEWHLRRQYCFAKCVSHSSHYIWTSYTWVELKGFKLNCPFQLHCENCERKCLVKYQAGCYKPALLSRSWSCCWSDWNRVWKLWSAKQCAVLVQRQGRGCFWDTRIYCRALWRLCGPN